ncbi:MAG: DUF5701 family protein [bacterium]|nr:DUF5701 family protein [bacterium]
MSEIIEVGRDTLIEVFDLQAKKLLDSSYERQAKDGSQDFLRRLSFLAKFVRTNEEILHLNFHENYIPCLIVIPSAIIAWYEQLSDVFIGQVGHLSLAGVCDKEAGAFYKPPPSAPEDIYLIFDVEPGVEYREDINNVRNRFNVADRRGLTVEEAIALLSYDPEMLTRTNLYLLGCAPGPGSRVMAMRADKGTVLGYANGVKSVTFGIPSTPKLNF